MFLSVLISELSLCKRTFYDKILYILIPLDETNPMMHHTCLYIELYSSPWSNLVNRDNWSYFDHFYPWGAPVWGHSHQIKLFQSKEIGESIPLAGGQSL